MRHLLGRLLALLDAAARAAIVITFTGMVGVVAAQVLLRYGFNSSIDWAEDVARLVFVWTMFLAIPLGVRPGVHIGVNLLVQRLPGAARAALARLTAAASLALMAIVAWGAVSLLPEQWDELLPTVDLSVGWLLLPVAVGAVHSALHLAALVLDGPAAEPAVAGQEAQ
jgi:TRAP-type C4-dicarboxylate transport system permease small subunit